MKSLYRKLNSQQGGMDKVLVTLLFVVIGVTALMLIEQWFNGKRDMLIDESNSKVTTVMNEVG